MVLTCHNKNKIDERPSLKKCWKWLKEIMKEYMVLKKIGKEEKNKNNLINN